LAIACPAKTISTLDVISAFDGPPVITSCATVHGDCDMASHCKAKEPLQRVNDGIRMLLTRISIAELAKPAEKARHADDLVRITC
jgi:DNA-binding IscR family transcriptional regulator